MDRPLSHLAQSYKAINDGDAARQTRWLTFWFVFSLLRMVHAVVFYLPLANSLPFKNELWIASIIFLAGYDGAATVYNKFVQPFLSTHEDDLSTAIEKCKKIGYAVKEGKMQKVIDESKDFGKHAQVLFKRVSSSSLSGSARPNFDAGDVADAGDAVGQGGDPLTKEE